MFAVLDALIQNGSGGRKALVLRHVCSLLMTVGIDGDNETSTLFDEVLANLASDLDDEIVLVLMPEVKKLPGVLPAFLATMSSRFDEIMQRREDLQASASVPAADPIGCDQEDPLTEPGNGPIPSTPPIAPMADFSPEAANQTHAPKASAAEEVAVEAPVAEMPVAEASSAEAPAGFLTGSEPIAPEEAARPERRAVPRDPVADAENLITLARRASLAELAAIARLPNLPESITNVLVACGDRAALEGALRNQTAAFAKSSLTTLAELAPSDRMIKEALISRRDLPEPIAERLMPFLTIQAKAQLLMVGPSFDESEALAALDQAAADLVTAYRNGQMLMGVDTALSRIDEGTITVSDVTIQLARDIRIAELAAFMAKQLAIRHLTAFNILSGRFDHATAVMLRALDISLDAFDAVMTMRRRCGCREARETHSVHAIAQRYTPAEALVLVRHMDEVEQGGKAAGAPPEQPEDTSSLAA